MDRTLLARLRAWLHRLTTPCPYDADATTWCPHCAAERASRSPWRTR